MKNSSFFLMLSAFFFGCRSAGPVPSSHMINASLQSQGTGMQLTAIPFGTFKMGADKEEYPDDQDETPQHKVTLMNPYYIGIYEVTQAEFELVMGFNPSTLKGSPRLPVETLSWYDAVYFCNRLSQFDHIDTAYEISIIKKDGVHIVDADVTWNINSKGYRLPTEAEWEKACRGGTLTPFPFGDNINTSLANYDGETPYLPSEPKGLFRNKSIEVDSLAPNGFGLYHIVGNVFEWCWDYKGPYSGQPQANPTGPEFGTERIRRGGAYTSPAHHMRSAVRHGVPPGAVMFHMGMRVAKSAN